MALPVLVAGAGPVGLTLACELDRLGVACVLADAAPGRTAVSRATDLHARSLETWDALGAADEMVAAGLAITGVPLLSGGRQVARLDFAGVDSPFPAAVSLPQHELPASAPPGVEALADAALRVHGRLGAEEPTALVVRPDGYLGFRCRPPDLGRLAGHLGRLGVRAG